ncbi:MAG: hypothetical protein P4M02_01970 [Clostridia bacterium]|nr:hypothetical protein [Clostridia bacterium]
MRNQRCEVCSEKFTYQQIMKSVWLRDAPIECCNMYYTRTLFSRMLFECLLYIPFILCFFLKFYIWLIVLLASLAALILLTPLITFYKARPISERRKGGKPYQLLKSINWWTFLGWPAAGLLLYLYNRSFHPEYTISDLIVYFILPVTGGILIGSIIRGLIKVYARKPEEPDESGPDAHSN